MRAKKIRHSQVRSMTIPLKGGLNEEVPSIEWKGGELLGSLNYMMREGSFGGYTSVSGYERFDGQESPSTVTATEDDHAARDVARAAIEEVGTTGTPCEGNVLGACYWKGIVYAFRKEVSGNFIAMFKSSATGWVEVDTSASPLVYDSGATHKFFFKANNFYATVASGGGTGSIGEELYWVDGTNYLKSYDGTTVSTIINAGMSTLDKPTNVEAHANRLWIAYAGGSLQYSSLGDPTDWSGTGTAGEIGVSDEITNLITGVGDVLLIFCDERIKILKGQSVLDFSLENFSDTSGAYSDTCKRMLGTVFYLDDRGVCTLEASDQFGDFSSNSIDQKVKRTIEGNRDHISTTLADRSSNQYRVYYDNKVSVYFSFLNKNLKGATIVEYPIAVLHTTSGEDSTGKQLNFFISDTGYVYQMDIGTSFDGAAIQAILLTSYYHYGSPRYWKTFKKLTTEVSTYSAMTLRYKLTFDYGDIGYKPSITFDSDQVAQGGRWDVGEWDTMTWSGIDVNRAHVYINGVGTNMSIQIYSEETYKLPHTVQNITTDFILGGRQI